MHIQGLQHACEPHFSGGSPGIHRNSPPEILSVSPVSHDTPAPPQPCGTGIQLLSALWRSPNRCHQIGVLDRQARQFKNIPVNSVTEAVRLALDISDAGSDTYLACAEYQTLDNRTVDNVSGALGFWMDIDCGEEKAAGGKGYLTEDDALQALRQFCILTGLPQPTHIVSSGGGLHVYWVLDGEIEREVWRTYAAKLKALTKAHKFLADPSRTADIASVLRIPGTLNHKYNPPKPVTLLSSTDAYIPLTTMLDAIDVASINSKVEAESPVSADKSTSVVALPLVDSPLCEPPNLPRLTSALKILTPDCDEMTWMFYRLAPLAYSARAFPELAVTLRALAIRWSSGELRGKPSEKWKTPGSNGLTGEQIFDRVWQRFLTDNYQGKRVTVGTIFYHAKEAGWVYEPDQPASVAGDVEGGL